MNKIWWKLQLGRAACTMVAVVLLFATSGNANALELTVQWSFKNTPTTVEPTDTIEMIATVEGFGDGAVGEELYVTGFVAEGILPGTLIGGITNGVFVPNGTDNPYSVQLLSGGFDPWVSVYNGSAEFTFGILTPLNGIQPDTYSSGFGFVTFSFSDDYFAGIQGNNIFTVNVVPEPSTLLLLASGLAGLAAWRRRKTG